MRFLMSLLTNQEKDYDNNLCWWIKKNDKSLEWLNFRTTYIMEKEKSSLINKYNTRRIIALEPMSGRKTSSIITWCVATGSSIFCNPIGWKLFASSLRQEPIQMVLRLFNEQIYHVFIFAEKIAHGNIQNFKVNEARCQKTGAPSTPHATASTNNSTFLLWPTQRKWQLCMWDMST